MQAIASPTATKAPKNCLSLEMYGRASQMGRRHWYPDILLGAESRAAAMVGTRNRNNRQCMETGCAFVGKRSTIVTATRRETGAVEPALIRLRRDAPVHLRGRDNISKRLVVHSGTANLGLLMRKLFGHCPPRAMQTRLQAMISAANVSACLFLIAAMLITKIRDLLAPFKTTHRIYAAL
jgi:hypothetical protein